MGSASREGNEMAPEKPSFPRPLTARERDVTRWLIAHGHASDTDKTRYLRQLELATVSGKCGCGCASVDFAIDGRESEEKEMFIIADFVTNRCEHGIFVFVRGGQLAGTEAYQLAGGEPLALLPEPVGFEPFPAGTVRQCAVE